MTRQEYVDLLEKAADTLEDIQNSDFTECYSEFDKMLTEALKWIYYKLDNM